MENLNQIVNAIINRNEWLSGWYDYREGDILDLIESDAEAISKVIDYLDEQDEKHAYYVEVDNGQIFIMKFEILNI